MSKPLIVECEKCDGVCDITHEQSHIFYEIKFCPFCGEELELEEEYHIEDFEDSEEYKTNNP
jgi:hypothetical protein